MAEGFAEGLLLDSKVGNEVGLDEGKI